MDKPIVSNFVKEILVLMDARSEHLRTDAIHTVEILWQEMGMEHTSVIFEQVNDKNVHDIFESLTNCFLPNVIKLFCLPFSCLCR